MIRAIQAISILPTLEEETRRAGLFVVEAGLDGRRLVPLPAPPLALRGEVSEVSDLLAMRVRAEKTRA